MNTNCCSKSDRFRPVSNLAVESKQDGKRVPVRTHLHGLSQVRWRYMLQWAYLMPSRRQQLRLEREAILRARVPVRSEELALC